ncbi:MAG: hypothetical protein RIB67_01070 [Miltoncostaeaceae bacterium]
MSDDTQLDPATREANEAARRRVAKLVLGAVALLFVVQLVAIATGYLEVSFAIFAAMAAGWFALRSYQKRHPV